MIVNGWIKTTRAQFKSNKIKQIDEVKDAHRSLNQGRYYHHYHHYHHSHHSHNHYYHYHNHYHYQ